MDLYNFTPELAYLPPVVAIDFDGKIVESNYPNIGDLKPYARIALKNIKKAGWTMILNTCRSNKKLEEARLFLAQHDIYFDYYNENDPNRIEFFDHDSRKIGADIYIDDRHLFGGDIGWRKIEEKLLSIFDARIPNKQQ